MWPGARRDLQVAAQDRRAIAEVNVVEVDNLASAVPKDGMAVRSFEIEDPVGARTEHRDQVALPAIIGDHDREPNDAASSAAADFQRGDSARPDPA